ncbi:MAG: glucose-6-phosphate dehydrogenase [Candidatus Levybacteria bacterium]|nr:glucose-6-phosphate dehydrogenase [Candidatus Levybacteria bacterium]
MSAIKAKNIPTVFIIFGATGDLMAKKIAPALFHLYRNGKFPNLFKIIAFSRRDIGLEGFKEHLRTILANKKGKQFKKEDIEAFLNFFEYQQGDFEKVDAYNTLASYLGNIDGEWMACSNKLFYLAVPPSNYRSIVEHLKTSGLTKPCGPDEGWTRVIVEKPFGKNAQTALELDLLLADLFQEEQIYRIDHYLGKDMLQNILSFRFNNDLFEDSWDKDHIEKIEIRFMENIGIEGRSTFYDGVGALRDVGQNHMLQMLAFVAMDQPKTFTAGDVRTQRAEILKKLNTLSPLEVEKLTYRGQYIGYKEVEGVSPKSTTETYFKIAASISSTRWSGIPIILEAGKELEQKKEIVVTFKHREPCLCPPGVHYKNKVFFTLEPKEGITIEFWSKKPGHGYEMEKQKLSFLFRDQRKKVQYVEEYERLLLDCITGNQLPFVSTDEVKAMWNFIDPIIEAWDKNKVQLVEYKPKTKKVITDSLIVEKRLLE